MNSKSKNEKSLANEKRGPVRPPKDDFVFLVEEALGEARQKKGMDV